MKTNYRISGQQPGRIVQRFGEARLFQRPDGKHELVGGTADDIANANDWASLVAHEVVFSQPRGKRRGMSSPKSNPLAIRLNFGRTGCA